MDFVMEELTVDSSLQAPDLARCIQQRFDMADVAELFGRERRVFPGINASVVLGDGEVG